MCGDWPTRRCRLLLFGFQNKRPRAARYFHPVSIPVSLLTSPALSIVLTNSITASALWRGQWAKSAQPRRDILLVFQAAASRVW